MVLQLQVLILHNPVALGADPAWPCSSGCWCCSILWHCWQVLHGHVLGLGVPADPWGHPGPAQPCSASWDPLGPAAPSGGWVPAGAVARRLARHGVGTAQAVPVPVLVGSRFLLGTGAGGGGDRGDAWGKSSVFNVPDSRLFLKTTR